MLSKPVECQGCPLYGSGNGFVPDELISNAEVDVWLQNPGQMEELKGVPAIGATGDTLNDTLLPAAGLTRGVDVSVRNVLRCRYNGGNKLPTGQILTKAIAHCRVHDIQTTARVSVACGALAWRMWGGPGSITDWRGFPHPSKPVLATLHPADLFRNPKMKLPVLQDFAKIRKCLDGTWPEPVPYFATVKSRNDLPKLREWTSRALLDAPYVVIDTEFTRDSKYLLVIGLGYPDNEGCQIWMKDLDAVARSEVKTWLMALVDTVPVVFQNAMADMPVLKRNLGIQYHDYLRVDDTMLAHAVLWSEWPHDLGYLASLYGKYPKMKHLGVRGETSRVWISRYLQTLLSGISEGERAFGVCQKSTGAETLSREELSVAQEARKDQIGIRDAVENAKRPVRDLPEARLTPATFVGSLPQNSKDARTTLLDVQCRNRDVTRESNGSGVLHRSVEELDNLAACMYN